MEYSYDKIPQVIIKNSLIASASAGITFFAFESMKNFETLNAMIVYSPIDLIKAIIAGLVSITACSNISTGSACIIGTIGSLVFMGS